MPKNRPTTTRRRTRSERPREPQSRSVQHKPTVRREQRQEPVSVRQVRAPEVHEQTVDASHVEPEIVYVRLSSLWSLCAMLCVGICIGGALMYVHPQFVDNLIARFADDVVDDVEVSQGADAVVHTDDAIAHHQDTNASVDVTAAPQTNTRIQQQHAQIQDSTQKSIHTTTPKRAGFYTSRCGSLARAEPRPPGHWRVSPFHHTKDVGVSRASGSASVP